MMKPGMSTHSEKSRGSRKLLLVVLFAGASEGFATAAKAVGYVAAGLIALGFLAALRLPRDAARTTG